MEIYRYVPARLIERPIEELNVEEFAKYLAKARYLEEVETNLFLSALSKLFGGE